MRVPFTTWAAVRETPRKKVVMFSHTSGCPLTIDVSPADVDVILDVTRAVARNG